MFSFTFPIICFLLLGYSCLNMSADISAEQGQTEQHFACNPYNLQKGTFTIRGIRTLNIKTKFDLGVA